MRDAQLPEQAVHVENIYHSFAAALTRQQQCILSSLAESLGRYLVPRQHDVSEIVSVGRIIQR